MTPKQIAEVLDENPLIMSLLYDIDLLPEQIKRGDARRRGYMIAVIKHMQAALESSAAALSARPSNER